jgi:hypothetical protein
MSKDRVFATIPHAPVASEQQQMSDADFGKTVHNQCVIYPIAVSTYLSCATYSFSSNLLSSILKPLPMQAILPAVITW